MPPKVITIHGVNPDPWQDEIHAVLKPYFETVKIRYTEYDGLLGPIKAVCHPVAVVAWIATGLGSLVALFVSRGWLPLWLLVGSFLALVVGSAVARRQRRACARRVARHINTAAATAPPVGPHVIAHSFGTFMTMRVLKLPETRFERVILVGSVVPRDYDWSALFANGRVAFSSLQHEVGSKDSVVQLVGYVRWLYPVRWFSHELGDGGYRGLTPGERVHPTSGSWAECAEGCETEPLQGVVHNVPLGELAHSDTFLGPLHAKRLWLPYLWGYSPREFDRFVNLCCDVATTIADGLAPWRLELLLEELADAEWTWTSHMPTAYYIEQALRFRLPAFDAGRISALVWPVIARSCSKVARAYEEPIDTSVQKALFPLHALRDAIDETVEGLH
jgi:hypothetical protein